MTNSLESMNAIGSRMPCIFLQTRAGHSLYLLLQRPSIRVERSSCGGVRMQVLFKAFCRPAPDVESWEPGVLMFWMVSGCQDVVPGGDR